MRFGLVILLWITFWSQLGQASGIVLEAVKEWLDPPEVEALSEWDQKQMTNGMLCTPAPFAYSADPDWAPKCWRQI
jgi:hypothetical protein